MDILLDEVLDIVIGKINVMLVNGLSLAKYIPALLLAFIEESLLTIEDGYINAGLLLNS